MFADNERISEIQVKSQFALAYLGPILLWSLTGSYSGGSMAGILLGILFLMIWLFYMIRCAHEYHYPEKYWGKWMGRVILLIFYSYLVFTGAWLCRQTGKIITSYMISGASEKIIVFLFIAISLCACQNLQARGRFAQAIWRVIEVLTIMLIVAALLYGNQQSIFQNPSVSGISEKIVWDDFLNRRDMKSEMRDMIHQAIRIVALFSGITLLPLLSGQVLHQGEAGRKMFRELGKTGLFLVILLLLCFLGFGKHGGDNLKYPVLDLMAGVKFPGGFIRRIDLIFLTLILFSLLFTMGSILFYGKQVMECMGLQCMKLQGSRILTAVFCFLLSMIEPKGRTLWEVYPELLMKIFLPFFLGVTLCNLLLKKGKREKTAIFLCVVLLLSGCQTVEPEKRAYPLVVGIDWKEGEYEIILSMAQLAESTGQGKTGGEGQTGDASGIFLRGQNKQEIMNIYNSREQLYLDPGHIQAVVFGENIIRNPYVLREVLMTMEKEHSLGNSASVFAAVHMKEVFDTQKTKEESLGKFLTGIYENRIDGEKPVTLAQIYRKIHNEGMISELSWLKVEQNGIFVDKLPLKWQSCV